MIVSFYDGLTGRDDSREATDATDWIVADLSALSHKTHPSYGCRPNPSHLQRAVTPDPDTSWSRLGQPSHHSGEMETGACPQAPLWNPQASVAVSVGEGM